MARTKLTEEATAFIVRSAAQFESPKDIIEAVNEIYGIRIVRQDVERCDPSSPGGKTRNLAKKWRELFTQSRAEALDALADVDLSHKVVRMRELSKLYRKLGEDAKPNVPLAAARAALLEQAAKEAGEAFTNKRELTGKDGGPIQVRPVLNLDALTLEELERFEAVALAAKAQGRKTITIPFTPVES
jgi:hypothetical protein